MFRERWHNVEDKEPNERAGQLVFFRVQSKEAETGLAEDLSLIHMALTTNR